MLTTLPQKAEPAHTALILVDVLNAFCAEGGAMHREGRELILMDRRGRGDSGGSPWLMRCRCSMSCSRGCSLGWVRGESLGRSPPRTAIL